MIYKCRNCGAHAIYSPEKQSMYCPYCDSVDCEELSPGQGMQLCGNCGAEINPGDYRSVVKCEACDSYIIFEERTTGEYEPHLIIPFKMGKKQAQELLKKEFGKRPFLPSDFLSESKLDKIEGMYVPYFMYDFDCDYMFRGTGHVVRRWRSGDYEYTETSNYRLERDMNINFEKVPVDASIAMADDIMDLLEPYSYELLQPFDTKYLSGFAAEKYNMSSSELEPRAIKKAKVDARTLMDQTLTRYSSVTDRQDNINFQTKADNYSLLPVWNYTYIYRGKPYPFKINGQTGKMSGKPPISIPKVIASGLTVFLSIAAIGGLWNLIMGVI